MPKTDAKTFICGSSSHKASDASDNDDFMGDAGELDHGEFDSDGHRIREGSVMFHCPSSGNGTVRPVPGVERCINNIYIEWASKMLVCRKGGFQGR